MYFRNRQWWVLVAGVLLAGCDLRLRGSTGVDVPVTQVIVYPDALTLDPQQSFQFRVFGRTETGDSVPVSVNWTASAGSISQSGMYTADTSATDVVVTAALTSSSVSGTSRVRKRRVVTLVIDPKNASLPAGGLQQFSVFGIRNTGDTVSVPVAYSATGGTISSTGAYAAGQLAGTYRVIANQNSGSLADTSMVTVSEAPQPPPPPPVATVTVSPANAGVFIGSVQQFTATLKDASGTVLTGRAVTWGSSSPTIAGVSVTGLVTGLLAGTSTITATSEGRSGSASLTVSVVPPGSGGVVFESDWTAGEPSDSGRWTHYWEFNNGTGVRLLSVVPGFGPGGRNALKVLQRGQSFAADLQQDNILPPSTDYYLRYYMRNDDTSPAGDHVVTPDIYSYANLTYMRKYSGTNGWTFDISMYGCSFIYPVSHIGPAVTLAHGVWYRFEFFVDFVDATHVQVHPRVYDASGTQIFGDADFRQQDWGAATLNGRSDWTLASLYATGFSYCVNPVSLQSFAVGNNGQAGAVDTGLSWYYAGVQIRTDRWPGP